MPFTYDKTNNAPTQQQEREYYWRLGAEHIRTTNPTADEGTQFLMTLNMMRGQLIRSFLDSLEEADE